MRRMYFIKAIWCVALFLEYSNILGGTKEKETVGEWSSRTREEASEIATAKGRLDIASKADEGSKSKNPVALAREAAAISERAKHAVPGSGELSKKDQVPVPTPGRLTETPKAPTAPAVAVKTPTSIPSLKPLKGELIDAAKGVEQSVINLKAAAAKALSDAEAERRAVEEGMPSLRPATTEDAERVKKSQETGPLKETAEAVTKAAEYQRKLHEPLPEQTDETKKLEETSRQIMEDLAKAQAARRTFTTTIIPDAPMEKVQLEAIQQGQTALVQPPKEATAEKQAQNFLQRNKKLLIAGGVIGGGLLALGGILGAILGATEDKSAAAAAIGSNVGPSPIIPPAPSPITPPTPAPSPITDIKPDIGILPPSPYPDAKEEDKDSDQETKIEEDKAQEKAIETIASFYTNIEEKFKQALEESSYFDKIFAIEGEVTIGKSTEKILIEYDFTTGGAGELGSPFTPFLVKMRPQGINGIALNPDDIKKLLPDGPARELFSMMIEPNAAFIFMIKIILLINTTLRDESKKDIDKISFIIDEATKLYSRLILTPNQDPTPDALISKMPQIFQKIIAGMSLKMYGDLVYNVNDSEGTVLIKRIGELQKLRDYLGITKFVKKEITPAIKKDITHTEKQLLLYSLQKLLADCPKTGRDLWNHVDQLIAVLTDVKKGMVKAKVDKETIAKVDTLLKQAQDVKAGIKKVTVLNKKPELEISTELYSKDVSLDEVLKILFKNFSKIYYAKFKGDKGYSESNVLIGKNATRYALQSIFFRCLSETLESNQILSAAKGNVTLRMAANKKSTINPDKEFTKICDKSSLKFVQAQATLKDAILKLVANPNDTQLKEEYDKAITDVTKASEALFADQVKFRRTYAVYLPMKQDDNTTQTPAELVQKRLGALRKNSKYVDGIIAKEYAPFKNALGISSAFLGIKSK